MVPSNSTEKLKWKTRTLASSFLWEGEQWAFCGASTSSPNKRASLDEELEKLPQNVKKAPLELDIKKWRVIQLKKDFCWWGGWETRKKEEWAVKEGSLPQRRRKMFGPLDNTKDHSLLQGSHQHSLLLSLTNPVFHLTHSSIAWFSTFLSQGWSVVASARWHLLGPDPICSRWDIQIIILNIIIIFSAIITMIIEFSNAGPEYSDSDYLGNSSLSETVGVVSGPARSSSSAWCHHLPNIFI